MKNIIHESEVIYKSLEKIKIQEAITKIALKHIVSIIMAVFTLGYKGKTVNFEKYSANHRTTIAHFLNKGKWEDKKLEKAVKDRVKEIIYSEALKTGNPIYVMVDDTIMSKTKPSSQALNPIEDAYFHQSHLKKKQDYGHQAVAVLMSCNGITLCYDIVMYDKSKSKVQIAADIAKELPTAPVVSYFLCDSWYTGKRLINEFLQKGFYTIGAIRTNRVIYPCNIKKKINEFALFIRKTDRNVRLVTVGKRQYYVYRYEGSLNGIDNAVVLITYPKDAFHNPKALKTFVSTDTSLTTDEILSIYSQRWAIEVFFRQAKNVLALNKYQVRSSMGIKRFWLIMSLVYLLCCTHTGQFCSFQDGFSYFAEHLHRERISFIYQQAVNNVSLDDILKSVA